MNQGTALDNCGNAGTRSKSIEIIGMTIKILLLSPYHIVLRYVMLCDHACDDHAHRQGERGVHQFEKLGPPITIHC